MFKKAFLHYFEYFQNLILIKLSVNIWQIPRYLFWNWVLPLWYIRSIQFWEGFTHIFAGICQHYKNKSSSMIWDQFGGIASANTDRVCRGWSKTYDHGIVQNCRDICFSFLGSSQWQTVAWSRKRQHPCGHWHPLWLPLEGVPVGP